MINNKNLEILKRARDTYGNKNQILVCIEELNELACVLAKFPRYNNEEDAVEKLHYDVLDEVADVTIILNHVKSILQITDEEVDDRVDKKVARLNRWLNKSTSMQQTTEDRTVEVGCDSCGKRIMQETEMCATCRATACTEGRYPFYTPVEG